MEVIGFLILMWLGWWIFGQIANSAYKTGHAVKNTVQGKGSFQNNMKANFKGIGNFEIKLTDSQINELPNSPKVKEIHCRGLFPIRTHKNLGIILSVFDNSTDELQPVFSMLEEFQESNNITFQHKAIIGQVSPTQGFIDWVPTGVVIPDILIPPMSGDRNLKVFLRLVNLNIIPKIIHGYKLPDDRAVLWESSKTFQWYFEEKGYQEAAENREESAALALKIGVSVAMSDGVLHDREGDLLKKRVSKNIEPYSDHKKSHLKKVYNNALREAYKQSLNGRLNLHSLITRLNEIGEKRDKYEVIELAYDIMAADGVADQKELQLINDIASELGLNISEVKALRDKRLVNLDSSSTKGADIEQILDINPNWENEKIKKHLSKEFNKWNNRLNTLPSGSKRENAQKMLDLISEARKKYG